MRRDDPDTWCNLGAVYAHMGLELESEEACREAIALDPQHAKARFNLAYLRHTGKWHELFAGLTLDECLKSIQDDPWFTP